VKIPEFICRKCIGCDLKIKKEIEHMPNKCALPGIEMPEWEEINREEVKDKYGDGYRCGIIIGLPIFIIGLFYESVDHFVGVALMSIGWFLIFIVTMFSYGGVAEDEIKETNNGVCE